MSLSLVVGASVARAQSAADRAAAAQAYDRASAAYLAEQFDRAATLFETAYRVLPNATALMQAAQSHRQAGHAARSATLAHRLRTRYADSPQAQDASELVEGMQASLLRIELSADASYEWEIDGALQDSEDSVVFVDPGEHDVRVTFETGTVDRHISGVAGALTHLELAAPEAPTPEPEPAPAVAPTGTGEVAALRDEASSGLSPWVFGTLIGATAVSAGFLVGFGVDARSGLDAYRSAPTRAGLEDGQRRELRTNIMFGVTGGLAIATLVIALLTDWDPEDGAVSVAPVGDGALLTFRMATP